MSWRRQRWQYQSYATGLPDTITTGGGKFESQWHQPYTDPQTNFIARLRAVAGIALIASGVIAPVVLSSTQEPGNSYESTYHQPWSEPVRLNPAAISRAYEQQTLAHAPFNEDFRIVTKWHQPWSEPVRFKPRATEFPSYTSGWDNTLEPGGGYESAWHQPWSEPVRLRANVIRQAQDADGAWTETQQFTVPYDRWGFQWTDPIRRKPFQNSLQEGISEPFPTGEVITIDKWFAAYQDPVRRVQFRQQDAWIGKLPICAAGPTIFTTDKVAGLSVSDDGLMVTRTDVSDGLYDCARANRSHASQKWYFEARVHNGVLGDRQGLGVANSTLALTNLSGVGFDANGIAFYTGRTAVENANLFFNGANVVDFGVVLPVQDAVVRFAVDVGNKQIWVQPAGLNWNNNGAADPATGVGGVDISAITGALFPATAIFPELADATDFNFGSFNFPIPSGFLAWDADEAQFYGWQQQFSQPTRRPFFQNSLQEGISEPFVTTAETVTVDKWFVSFQDPQRRKFFQGSIQEGITELGFPDTVSWYAPWRDPTPAKPGLRAAAQQAYTSGWEDTLEPGATYEAPWHQPWSEPVRVKPRATEFPSYTSGWDSTLEPGATYTTWYQRLSEPVRLKPRATDFPAYIGLDHFFEVVTVDKWFSRGPDFAPGKIGLRTASQQALVHAPFVEDAGIEAKWHFPWSEPVRIKPRTTEFPSYVSGWDKSLEPGGGYESAWHQPWSEPVRRKFFQNSIQEGISEPFVFTTETITVDKWFKSLEDPVRTRLFPTSEQQAVAHTPFVEDTTFESKWHSAWSEPVRIKPGVGAQLQQAQAQGQFIVVRENVTVDKWFKPLEEPVRFRRFPTSEQQALVHAPFNQDQSIEARWHQPWSTPVKLKFYLSTAEQQALIYIPFNQDQRIEARWHQPWSIPVVLGRPFKTNLQMTIAQTESALFRGGPYAVAYVIA